MGFVTTGKPLSADHPFFMTTAAAQEFDREANAKVPLGGAVHQEGDLDEDDDDDEDDEDDEFYDGEDHGREDKEDNQARFEEGDSTFFDAAEQIEVDQNEGSEGESSGVNTE
jgi:hypothetical protein